MTHPTLVACRSLICCWLVLGSTFPLMIEGCKRTATITISQIPKGDAGGVGTHGVIAGRVDGPHSGRSIVLYSFADGRWWVQPFASSPYTQINKDGSWHAGIHLGTRYAAILMREEGLPKSSLLALPEVSNTVEAISLANPVSPAVANPAPAKSGVPLRFSGYDWQIRTIPSDYASKSNEYLPENVSLDGEGALHLRIFEKAGGWTCSELHSVRSLGYGTYRFSVRELGRFEPAVMFSLFTRVEESQDNDHKQMDIHMSQRGDPSSNNGEFVVQPYYVPTNFYRFNLPPGPAMLELQWSTESAKFLAWRGGPAEKPLAASWVFTTGVPTSDDGQIYMNFCNYGKSRVPLKHGAEVVVDKFEFYP